MNNLIFVGQTNSFPTHFMDLVFQDMLHCERFQCALVSVHTNSHIFVAQLAQQVDVKNVQKRPGWATLHTFGSWWPLRPTAQGLNRIFDSLDARISILGGVRLLDFLIGCFC